MMAKSKLLLLDANIVLELISLGILVQFLDQFDVHLAETVMRESHTSPAVQGIGRDTNLQEFVDLGKLTIVSATLGDARAFAGRFNREYADRLDPGELESLTILCNASHSDYLICSADAIVYKTLGLLDMRPKAACLETLLNSVGLSHPLDHQYREPYMNKHLDLGFQDRMTGFGLK